MNKSFVFVLLSILSFSVWATEKINIYFGFSPASQTANNYRVLIAELNQIQTKYEFVLETTAGAGGAIAAKHLLQNPNTSLLGANSTFFIRANFDKNTGYNVDQFRPVIVQSTGAPVVLYSNKYKTFADVKQSDVITTGISGFGSHSNLMSAILAETHKNMIIVNYPTLVEAGRDALGQHIDASWWWLGEAESLVASKGYILGITGTRSIKGYKTFASQGIRGFEQASTNQAVFASASMPSAKVKELHELLQIANQAPSLQTLYAKEYAIPANFNWGQTIDWYNDQNKFWVSQSVKVKLMSVDQK